MTGGKTPSEPKRILIDSMIVDLIAAESDLPEKIARANTNGCLVIVETHILPTQLSATRCESRRALLLETYEALPRRPVSTGGFVLGVSTFASADLGESMPLGDVMTAGRGRMEDALLAATASLRADVLVTADVDLQKKARSAKDVTCEVWNVREFLRFIEACL